MFDLVSNEKDYNMLTTPVCAFITFEKDEAEAVALEYSAESKKMFLSNESEDDRFRQDTIFNRRPVFKRATDPTNIIWENRHIKGWTFQVRLYRSYAVIFLVLILSMIVIYTLKKQSMVMIMKYPLMDCESVFKVYGTDMEDKMKYAAFEMSLHDAGNKGEDGENMIPSLGSLQCFCTEEFVKTFNPYKVYNYTDIKGNKQSTAICSEFILKWEAATQMS